MQISVFKQNTRKHGQEKKAQYSNIFNAVSVMPKVKMHLIKNS